MQRRWRTSCRVGIRAIGLLRANPDPSEDEIRAALAGNLCRCTGYVHIVEAIRTAAETLGGDPA